MLPRAEYLSRIEGVQTRMAAQGLAALLLTQEADIRYLTGYLTRFWESPTRPWFLVLPLKDLPIAVIPSIGAALMAETVVEDVRTWSAPDYGDDGVSLLASTLREVAGNGRIGTPFGIESHLRMPLGDWARLSKELRIGGDDAVMRAARMVKTPVEVEAIRIACQIAGSAFARVPEIACGGMPLSDVFRRFQILCLEEGADWVPYLAGGAGPEGYEDVISPASDAPLQSGDILMLDTGVIKDGYFSDFDRNFSVGAPSLEAERAYDTLMHAMQAGEAALKPGNTAADVFHAMDHVCTGGSGGQSAGRLGHGLGLQLTEGLSFIADDHTVLEAGMVITLEPGVSVTGGAGLMVHEDDYVVTDTGWERLSPAPPAQMIRLHT
ncbi:M24 family metallopeptidase [Planktotalea arctica]|uniref:M24 family metallopeptidase n=1 Tax=Planktotalea arctica TaxID=1481893 RepID=UPI000A16D7AF|nr:Xaa-Pro peptidase family protein [Planktotalea arctica]